MAYPRVQLCLPRPDQLLDQPILLRVHHNHHHHHRICVMELGYLLTRSGLWSSKVCHDSFCHSGTNVSLPSVICYEAFCLHVVLSSGRVTHSGKTLTTGKSHRKKPDRFSKSLAPEIKRLEPEAAQSLSFNVEDEERLVVYSHEDKAHNRLYC
jgi:hypothetical protein